MLTFKYKLIVSPDIEKILWLHANKLNWLQNYFLAQRIENYKAGIKTSWIDQGNQLPSLKEQDLVLKQIHSQVLQAPARRLDKSYKSFFRRVKNGKEKAGFPKFRGCHEFYGITYSQSGYKIRGSKFITKQYGSLEFIKHREIKGKIKMVTITCKNNEFYLHITTDYELPNNKTKTKEIGIDLGLKNIVVGSDGLKIENINHAKYFDKEIAKLQSKQSKCKKGSRKYRHYRKVMNRLYQTKSRKMNDFQHKVSRRLANTYDTIYAEDLSVKRMMQSNKTGLNKSVGNAKLSQLLILLGYKVNHLVLVNPKNTSKTCNSCGFIHKSLELKDRTITCQCGATYDRDENASKNILCLGQAIVNKRCTESETIQEALAVG